MKIKVTQEYIDAGVQGDCNTCPIAIALKESTGELWSAGITFCCPCKRPSFRFATTVEMVRFMRQFDAGLIVKPTEFDVSIEEPA